MTGITPATVLEVVIDPRVQELPRYRTQTAVREGNGLIAALGNGMAVRKYLGSDGVAWQVWEVIPQSVERRKLRERRTTPRGAPERRKRHEIRLRMSDGEADGWLVFESHDLKKRLRPIPNGWHLASETELESMCARAERANRTTRRLIE